MSYLSKYCAVCAVEEFDPDELETVLQPSTRCFKCYSLIGTDYGKEIFLIWKDSEEDGIGIQISE